VSDIYNVCEASEELIVLTNGDDKSDLCCYLLTQSEALCTCRSDLSTTTVLQRIQVTSILLHEAKPVLGLFCLHWTRL